MLTKNIIVLAIGLVASVMAVSEEEELRPPQYSEQFPQVPPYILQPSLAELKGEAVVKTVAEFKNQTSIPARKAQYLEYLEGLVVYAKHRKVAANGALYAATGALKDVEQLPVDEKFAGNLAMTFEELFKAYYDSHIDAVEYGCKHLILAAGCGALVTAVLLAIIYFVFLGSRKTGRVNVSAFKSTI